MYLYSALYYFITALSSTDGDVVLAANIEDFRTIAKRFVPENLADTIFKMAKDAISHDANKQLNEFPKFRDIAPDTYIATVSYNTESAVRSEYNKTKESESSSTKRTTSKYELSLDDIVEKIKKRLQSELTLMAATADMKTTTEKSFETPKVLFDNPIKPQSVVLEDGQQSRYINPPSRYLKQTRNDIENKSREEEGPERKSQQQPTINDSDVTQQSKIMLSQSKLAQDMKPKYAIRPGNHKALTTQHNNKKHMKRNRKINLLKRTSTTSGIFSAVNLALKDSYEDYVAPKKDEDYFEPETEATKPKKVNTDNYYSKREPVDHVDKKILNIFSDETETSTTAKEYINYEDETTNYNKRKIKKASSHLRQKHNKHDGKHVVEILPFKVASNIEQDIQPYRDENGRENLQEKEYTGDNEQPAAKTSEGIFSNTDSDRQYVTSDIGKHTNKNRFKINGRQSSDTVLPKRNTNGLNSPENLIKIPEADEKYNVGEPIQNEYQYRIE